jgi:hypothetical protein
VVATAAAYFGEVVRRRLGGRWEATDEDVSAWRMILPTGVQFSPAGFVATAIARSDQVEIDNALEAPDRMRPYLQDALAGMSPVTEDDYYSLGGRLDTIEHVHEVLIGVAAKLLGSAPDPGLDDLGEPEAEDPASEPGTDPGPN